MSLRLDFDLSPLHDKEDLTMSAMLPEHFSIFVSMFNQVNLINTNKTLNSSKLRVFPKGFCSELSSKSFNGNGGVRKKHKMKSPTNCIPSILKALDQVEDLDEALGPWKLKITNKVMSVILKEQMTWERALEIFLWFKRKGCDNLNVIHCNIMLRVLGKAGEWGHVQRLWDWMNGRAGVPKEGIAPDIVTFSTMIDMHGKAGQLKQASAILALMLKEGIAPNTVTFSTMIGLHGKAGQLQEATKIFALMLREGIAPDRVTFNIMIDMHGKAGHLQEASEVLALMRREGIASDVVTFNSIIHMHSKVGQLQEAFELFASMPREGIAPDAVTFTTMIHMHGKAGQLQEASEVFASMRREGIAPDIVTFSTMMDMHGKAGQLKQASAIFALMLKEGIAPNTVTLNTIIDMHGKAGQLKEASEIFAMMLREGITPNTETFCTMIDMHGKAGHMEYDYIDSARNYFTMMKEACLEPDLGTYYTLLNAYSVRNMVREAEDLILEMDERGLESLFDRLKRTGDAKELELKFSMTLCMYKRLGRFVEAIPIAEQMRERRLLTDLLSCNIVIGLYVTYGRYKEVVEIVMEMMEAPIRPNEYTLRLLRLVLVESGISDQIVEMMEVSVKKDVCSGLQTWVSVISSLV